MKNKFFNKGLYLEGIRQLRMVGIIAFVIFSVEAILIPIGRIITISRYSQNITYYGSPKTVNVDAFSSHLILVFSFIIFAPILVMTLFHFLNKRSTADFYHSLPHSRITIFISFFSAVLTWLAIIIFGSSLVSGLTHLIFSNTLILDYIGLLKFSLNCFAASFLVVSAIAVAMTITGTTFSNIVVSGLIIFLPRFAFTTVSSLITSMLPMVPYGQLFTEYNIVTGTIFVVLSPFTHNFINPMTVLFSIGAFIYTFVLALIYTAIACFLFKKRKSEYAGNSAPNRILQAIYRITVTMAFCIIICITIFRDSFYSNDNTFTYVVLYIIAILIYFIYELVTTKRWKNLLRAIPGLAIVAALNGLILGGMYGIYYMELNYMPSPDKIKSITVVEKPQNYNYNYNDPLSYEQYIWLTSTDIETDDKEAISYVSQRLRAYVEAYKANPKNYINNLGPYNIAVKIKTSLGSKYRRIYVSNGTIEELYKAMFENDKFKQMLVKLPELSNDNYYVSQSIFEVTGDKALEIYKTMKDELKEVKLEEWRQAMAEEVNAPKVIIPTRLTSNYGAYVKVEMPLTEKLTPKAYALFKKELDKSKIKVNFEKFINALTATQYQSNARKIELKIYYFIFKGEYIQYEYSAHIDNYGINSYIGFIYNYPYNMPIQSDTSYAEIEFKVYDKNIKNETPFIYNFVVNLDGIENYNLPAGAKKIK